MSFRIIEAYLNVDTQQWCASDGSNLIPSRLPSFGISKILLRLHLIHDDGTECTDYSSATSFTTSIYTAFSAEGVKVEASAVGDVNVPGDWDEVPESEGVIFVEGANIEKGRLSIRMNCVTTEMVAQLSGLVVGHYWFNLLADVGGIPYDNLSAPIICRNVPDITGSITPVPVSGVSKGTVSVDALAESVTVTADVTLGSPICALLAPDGDTNNIGVSNIQCASDKQSFTAYLTAPVPTTGFRLTYVIIS